MGALRGLLNGMFISLSKTQRKALMKIMKRGFTPEEQQRHNQSEKSRVEEKKRIAGYAQFLEDMTRATGWVQ